MEQAFRKLLFKLFSDKFPMYVDIHVLYKSDFDFHNYRNKDCYEVFLIILEENVDETDGMYIKAKELINNLAKYMGINVCGVFQEVFSREEWDDELNN